MRLCTGESSRENREWAPAIQRAIDACGSCRQVYAAAWCRFIGVSMRIDADCFKNWSSTIEDSRVRVICNVSDWGRLPGEPGNCATAGAATYSARHLQQQLLLLSASRAAPPPGEDDPEWQERQREMEEARMRKEAAKTLNYALPGIGVVHGVGQMPSH